MISPTCRVRAPRSASNASAASAPGHQRRGADNTVPAPGPLAFRCIRPTAAKTVNHAQAGCVPRLAPGGGKRLAYARWLVLRDARPCPQPHFNAPRRHGSASACSASGRAGCDAANAAPRIASCCVYGQIQQRFPWHLSRRVLGVEQIELDGDRPADAARNQFIARYRRVNIDIGDNKHSPEKCEQARRARRPVGGVARIPNTSGSGARPHRPMPQPRLPRLPGVAGVVRSRP